MGKELHLHLCTRQKIFQISLEGRIFEDRNELELIFYCRLPNGKSDAGILDGQDFPHPNFDPQDAI